MVEYVYQFIILFSESPSYWMYVESYIACQEMMDLVTMETKYIDPQPDGVSCKELPIVSQAPMPQLRPQGY